MTLRDDLPDDAPGHGASPGEGGSESPRGVVTAVVVDPHAAVREGLGLLLRPQGVEVLAAAATGAGGEALIWQHVPDVALIALDLADVDGIVLLNRLLRRGARTAVVLYTDEEDAQQAAVALHAGAAGAIAKRRSIAELASALRGVAAGGMWFNEPGEARLARVTGAAAAAPAPERLFADFCERRSSALSSAELRVLALVAEGSSTEEAAAALSLSPHTVRTHLRNLMRKLEASSRAHAVAIAIRESAIQV